MLLWDHEVTLFRTPRFLFSSVRALALLAFVLFCSSSRAAEPTGVTQYRKTIEPILDQYCFGCHGTGSSKGGVVFDQDEPEALVAKQELWWKAQKMLRAGLMPPQGKPRPNAEQLETIDRWIKEAVFHIDPKNPDPGRVTVRRLNRTEYRNTIRDLMGVNYDTDAEFPPDDTGHGFDTIGEVLSLSPLLMEKYIAAARSIVSRAVPSASAVVAEKRIAGQRFRAAEEASPLTPTPLPLGERGRGEGDNGPLSLSYYKPATVAHPYRVEHAGHYQLVLDLAGSEKFVDGVFDYNKCRLLFKADGKVLLDKEYTRQGGRRYHYELEPILDWQAGPHELTLEVQPLTPNEKQVRSLALRIEAVTVRGPLEKEFWVPPPNYAKYFPRPVPEGLAERRAYARELLRGFATKAFRRPVDEETLNRLGALAESIYTQKGRTFEAGIAQAITAILASPRFLFREEGVEPSPANTHPLIDEYALASRLSYFLWSSMPDDELFRLAGEHKLRAHLPAQIRRMLADPRSAELVRQFIGQWLQARDIESVEINARAVMARENAPDPQMQQRQARFRELFRKPQESLTEAEKKELADLRATVFAGFRRFAQFDLTSDLRKAMRRETEMLFEYIVQNDRSLLELLDSDYTFLNERLAKHYGIDNVTGDEMRRVQLPPDSPRGGVLTQGTVLITTSNPDRTSPVKRGLFILDNLLGIPPAPPPPDIPALEEAAAKAGGKTPTLRETLQLHRSQSLCSSCHNRMDPLGLALENFNALGRWRDKERGQPIDSAGQLITGEPFANVRELKRVLVTDHRRDFYRCLTEKLLTYALGRGLEYYDVQAVDEIVARLEKENGHASALILGVIDSAPFQKRRAESRLPHERGGEPE